MYLFKMFLLLKATILHVCFSRFLNCTNSNKSHKASQMENESVLGNKLLRQVRQIEYVKNTNVIDSYLIFLWNLNTKLL